MTGSISGGEYPNSRIRFQRSLSLVLNEEDGLQRIDVGLELLKLEQMSGKALFLFSFLQHKKKRQCSCFQDAV